MTGIFLPKEIYFGVGSLDQLDTLGERCKAAYIVTDQSLVNLGVIKNVTSKLDAQGIEYLVYHDVKADPCRSDVENGLDKLKKQNLNPDWIIAVGGGSVIDVAKAIFVFWENPDFGWGDVLYPAVIPKLRKKWRLLGISTTSGSGSEVSMASVITNMEPEPPIKEVILSPEIIADVAIADPRMTMELPPEVTATTGLDAVVHAIEGYTTRGANDFSDALALRALKLVFGNLPAAYKEGAANMAAREKMAIAQLMATAACANSGLGLSHAFGQPLGTVYKIPHGAACGIPLPHVIKFNAKKNPVCAGRYTEITEALGIQFTSENEAVEKLIQALVALQKSINIPLAVKDLGIAEDDFERNVNLFSQLCKDDRGLTGHNPVEPTVEEIKEIFLNVFYGKGL